MSSGTKSSKFHFQEIDWIIYFPSSGNEGRTYLRYGVKYHDRKNKSDQKSTAINLSEVLGKSEIHDNYPHKIGYYVKSSGKERSFTPNYQEVRVIRDIAEFFQFLNDMKI